MEAKKDKEIRVLIFGAGAMGRFATKYLAERGAKVVAAVARKNNIGKDMGELSEIGPIGVPLVSVEGLDLTDLIQKTRPNIALDCTDMLDGIASNVKKCLENGLDVIMLAEDAYYPYVTHAELAKELDSIAKDNDVSLIGLGMQDVNWSNEAVVMSGNCINLRSIYGENWCILDHAGVMEMEKIGAGLTEEEFYEYHKNDLRPRGPYNIALYEIADELKLHVVEEINHKLTPIFATKDFETSNGLGTILKNRVMGLNLCSELHTEEGITLIGKFVYAYSVDGATGVNIWRFEGEPSFEVVTDDPMPYLSTVIDAVLRVPDVMNARSGYLTVKDLPKPYYKHGALSAYLHQ